MRVSASGKIAYDTITITIRLQTSGPAVAIEIRSSPAFGGTHPNPRRSSGKAHVSKVSNICHAGPPYPVRMLLAAASHQNSHVPPQSHEKAVQDYTSSRCPTQKAGRTPGLTRCMRLGLQLHDQLRPPPSLHALHGNVCMRPSRQAQQRSGDSQTHRNRVPRRTSVLHMWGTLCRFTFLRKASWRPAATLSNVSEISRGHHGDPGQVWPLCSKAEQIQGQDQRAISVQAPPPKAAARPAGLACSRHKLHAWCPADLALARPRQPGSSKMDGRSSTTRSSAQIRTLSCAGGVRGAPAYPSGPGGPDRAQSSGRRGGPIPSDDRGGPWPLRPAENPRGR